MRSHLQEIKTVKFSEPPGHSLVTVRSTDIHKPLCLVQFPVIIPTTTSFYLENKSGSNLSFTLLADLLDKHSYTCTATISHLMNGMQVSGLRTAGAGELLSLGFPLLWAWQQW